MHETWRWPWEGQPPQSHDRRDHPPSTVILALAERDGWDCHYCGETLDPYTATRDHKTPKARGGSNDLDNLVLSCEACQRRKKTQPYEDYMRRIEKPVRRD